MRLREVRLDDVDTYARIRCDPVMMAELGGPQPRADLDAMVRRHVRDTRSGAALVCMIVPGNDPGETAGTVTLTVRAGLAEMGWAVLPEFQGRGLAKAAVRLMVDRMAGRWAQAHAYPATTNAASNAVCSSTGFTLLGQADVAFAGKLFRTNHWRIGASRS